MEFENARPSVVRSIRQRVLLNAWLRACQSRPSLPGLTGFEPEDLADEVPDIMRFAVDTDGANHRFLITHEGSRLATTYGSENLRPEQRVNRYLDEAIGPERYARVAPCYLACTRHRRPTYSISVVRDADGKEVSFERLLLPFGSGRVEHIVGSYKSISIDGAFRLANLMGEDAPHKPMRRINAVIAAETMMPLPGRGGDDVIATE